MKNGVLNQTLLKRNSFSYSHNKAESSEECALNSNSHAIPERWEICLEFKMDLWKRTCLLKEY